MLRIVQRDILQVGMSVVNDQDEDDLETNVIDGDEFLVGHSG